MKVVFLDCDGVINAFEYNKNTIHEQIWMPNQLKRFDMGLELRTDLIERVNKITDSAKAKIVISSSWRIGDESWFSLLKETLTDAGIRAEIIGRTPRDNRGARGREIYQYLKENKDITSFVILDDDTDMEPLLSYHVHTNGNIGIQDCDVELAIRILERKTNEQESC